MKKLLIALATVALAAGVQAASFTWKTGNYTQFRNADGTAVTTAEGYTAALNGGNIVLVLLANGTYDGAMTVLTGTGGDTAAFRTTGTAATKYGLNTAFGFIYDEDDPSSSILQNGDVLGVMYQDSNGDLSKLFYVDADGNKLGDIETTYTVSGVTDDSWSGSTFIFTDAGTSAAPNYVSVAASAVPEPTSGLLLLLGMAGLALRRKRA
ncbi:MAG: PEP-CTERM sorting domain-containing protein [Kiritimatiellia bacterium]